MIAHADAKLREEEAVRSEGEEVDIWSSQICFLEVEKSGSIFSLDFCSDFLFHVVHKYLRVPGLRPPFKKQSDPDAV
jgi:hypothetical protein